MADGFTLRKATEADVGLVLHFIKGIAEYEKMSEQVVNTEEMLHEWMFERKLVEVLIAEEDGRPIGFALYFQNYSTFVGRAGLYLEDLYIEPPYRGKGYGKRVLKRLAEIAVERGCKRMEWVCLDWNAPSIAFYKKLGAVPLDEWTTFRLTGEALEKLGSKE